VNAVKDRYPTVFELFQEMKIDQDIETPSDLLNIWHQMSAIAHCKFPSLSPYAHLCPPQNDD
jgi:hypothetical protein